MIRKAVIILTLLLNAFLSLRLAGEYDYLWKYEINILQDIISLRFDGINLFNDYFDAFPLTIILSLLGQLILAISLFVKDRNNRIIKVGILFLWSGLLNIAIAGFGEFFLFFLIRITPFTIVSIWLFWLVRNKGNFSPKPKN